MFQNLLYILFNLCVPGPIVQIKSILSFKFCKLFVMCFFNWQLNNLEVWVQLRFEFLMPYFFTGGVAFIWLLVQNNRCTFCFHSNYSLYLSKISLNFSNEFIQRKWVDFKRRWVNFNFNVTVQTFRCRVGDMTFQSLININCNCKHML